MVEAKVLKDVLKRYREGKLAHAFLLETNDSNKCYKDVIELLKNLNCPFEYSDDFQKLRASINKTDNELYEAISKCATKLVYHRFGQVCTLYRCHPS